MQDNVYDWKEEVAVGMMFFVTGIIWGVVFL